MSTAYLDLLDLARKALDSAAVDRLVRDAARKLDDELCDFGDEASRLWAVLKHAELRTEAAASDEPRTCEGCEHAEYDEGGFGGGCHLDFPLFDLSMWRVEGALIGDPVGELDDEIEDPVCVAELFGTCCPRWSCLLEAGDRAWMEVQQEEHERALRLGLYEEPWGDGY